MYALATKIVNNMKLPKGLAKKLGKQHPCLDAVIFSD
jgi:hypothetical protein